MDIRKTLSSAKNRIVSLPGRIKAWIHHMRNLTPEEKQAIRTTTTRVSLLYFGGFTIFLFMSFMVLVLLTRSEKEIVVPDVTGKRFAEVYNSLVRKGLKPVISFEDMMDMDDGVILTQHPESGTVVAEDTKIKLEVSRSELHLPVPNLTGMELPIATNKLKNLHLQGRTISILPGVISYIPSEKTPMNYVIDQSPKAGEDITPERKINLLVSSGTAAAQKTMPGVTGQSINLAYDLLASLGLNIEQTVVDSPDAGSSGQITAQDIAPGTPITPGTTVKLTVQHYTTEGHPYYSFEKFRYVIPDDEPEGLYEVIVKDSAPKRVVFSQRMKPGETMLFVFHRSGNAKLIILRDKKEIEVEKIDVE